ncbi:MAG TPA: ATP-binding cassette domain-containing protein [Thermotogota bacterium]|nr:ATP-binding cassette domain-containing protein [Thermotogota bacterium]HPJ87917.1 ATP-binding cassette domain-containing protein [Thermotogota bacterium]
MKNENLCEIRDLSKWFTQSNGAFRKQVSHLKAVDGCSFSIRRGETLGLVGESGCGKTTFGRTLVRIYQPTSGEFMYYEKGEENPTDIFKLKPSRLRGFRQKIQMIYQDPYGSLNPRMNIENIITEGLKIHGIGKSRSERREIIAEVLEKVGLRPEYMRRYPHEFSGGQRQRVGIARSLVVNPEFIICDEPVSALDVSVQAQVINILEGLKEDLNLTYLFIAHDLSVVKHISDRIAVMYLGKIIEMAETEELFKNTLHPYTKGLLDSIPVPNPHMRKKGKQLLSGDVPSPVDPPQTCRFLKRCPRAFERCTKGIPELREIEAGHFVACYLYD